MYGVGYCLFKPLVPGLDDFINVNLLCGYIKLAIFWPFGT